MSNPLTPKFAAELADAAYLIKDAAARLAFVDAYREEMQLTHTSMASGVTGGYILKKPHVMAVFSAGKNAYQGQAFAAFMGTASLYDALTDVNVGIGISSTGLHVHQGFNRAFESLLPEFRPFMAGLKNVTTLHCVGHSLGGAIATLAADWAKAGSRVAQANVYTFGSPRVGLQAFAGTCTQRVLAANIYRAHHKTDPIPMVPTWPFFHVPHSGVDYLIHSPLAAVPWEYHLMKHYVASSEAAGTWSKLQDERPQTYMKSAIEAWLQSDGIVELSAATLDLMEAALVYVLEKTAQAAGIVAVSAAASTFTLLDRLAMMLAQAAQLSASVSVWVYHLVKKMGALAGLVVKQGTDLTTAFIRMVFLRLHQRVADMVRGIARQLG